MMNLCFSLYENKFKKKPLPTQWSLPPLRLLPVGQWVFDKSPTFPGDRNPKGEGVQAAVNDR